LFNFYIGGHFEMAAILKILKTKSTTLSDNLFLCQVSKGPIKNPTKRVGLVQTSSLSSH
jgi:hypothetical protein